MSLSGFPGYSSDMDIGQANIPRYGQHVDRGEDKHPILVVKDVLAIGKHLEAIGAGTDEQIKRLSWYKGIAGEACLLRPPLAIQEAVPHHNTSWDSRI